MSSRRWRIGRVSMGVVRALLVLLVLQLTATCWSLHRAHAATGDALLSLGAQLMLYQNARKQSAPSGFTLNGLGLLLSHGTTSDSPARVLDQFAAMCRTRSAHLAKQQPRLAHLLARTGVAPGLLTGVLRAGDQRHGVVACIDTGDGPLSLQQFGERIADVLATGDFARLGGLRYVSVQGDARGSSFISLFSEGELVLGRAFPDSGDVPGVDLPHVPRPPSSRRILSAWQQGRAEGVNVYLSARRDLTQLERETRAELQKRGYRLLNPPASKGATRLGVVVERAGESALFSFSKAPDGQSLVSIETL